MERLTDTQLSNLRVSLSEMMLEEDGITGELTDDAEICALAGRAASELQAYRNSGLTPERAAELGKADAEGRAVVLPCKVGDTVYAIGNPDNQIGAWELLCPSLPNAEDNIIYGIPTGILRNTTYLTRDAAAAALVREAADHE